MTRAESCADIADADVQLLIERLCDVEAEVVYFPVRHHSPVCAALVKELIDGLQPAAVLIEGPSNFNDRIDELLLKHEPPIAIYSYFHRAGSHHGAYYPFCEYSPEWLAAQRAHAAGAALRFIDLPWSEVAHLDRSTHRYADAELRRGRYVQNLCQRMHVGDFDELWDAMIESRQDLSVSEYLRRVHSFCYHIRLWENSISAADRQREAFMAEQIRLARTEFSGTLLVVTGGFHSSALAARCEGFACPGLEDGVEEELCEVDECQSEDAADGTDDPLAVQDAGIALISYSYDRLDSLTGYNAGLPSPGFYEHAWRQRQRGQEFSHQPLLVLLVEELRKRKQVLSTADLIAVETSARALSAIRGRTHVWRRDLIDAVTTSLIKDELEYGCESPFLDAVLAILRGRRRGRLAAGTRVPPLVDDINSQLAEADLQLAHDVRTIDLNLLTPADLAKSQLLHRLRTLAIAGYKREGGTDFLKRTDMARLWESWKLRWSPEFEATCVEAARYGTSLSEAVSARLTELARDIDRDASAATAVLMQAAQAGVETMSSQLLGRLAGLIQSESQFTSAAQALEHLLFLYCYDEAFGTSRTAQVGGLLGAAFNRCLWLVEMLGQSAGNERVLLHSIQVMLETYQRTATFLESIELDRDEFVAVMLRVEGDPNKPASLRGAAAGVLWTLGVADEQQVLSDLLMFASPEALGDFLAGLFALAREVAQRHEPLVKTIDRLLMEFGADDFQVSLPSLRLAFTYFTPREKHYMLTTLFESLGLKVAQPLAALTVDEETAAEALALEERIFQLMARYGLEASDE